MKALRRPHKAFQVSRVYRYKGPRLLRKAKERLSFTVAAVSVFAFIMGNMVGQHGWYAFWKSVLGKEDAIILFEGTAPPIAAIPDYEEWAKYGGSKAEHTFSQVPQSVLTPLPMYEQGALLRGAAPRLASQAYSTLWAGAYSGGEGSHPGVDIDAPRGTPVQSIANGIVEKTSLQTYGFGHYVLIRHPNVPDPDRPGENLTLYSLYAHLDSVLVRPGEVVTKAQKIGSVGNTGLTFGATGYHLYFQVEIAEAPFHPYWPFTSTDARKAGMTFMQAVNSTAFQGNLKQYTLNPMAFVQHYASYVAPAATSAVAGIEAQQATSVSSAPPLSPAERRQARVAARIEIRKARLAKRLATLENRVAAVTTSVETAADTAIEGTSQDVYRIEIVHDGSIGSASERISLRAVDRYGRLISSPIFSGKIAVRSEFGEATITPSELTQKDFQNGVAVVSVTSRSQRTVVLSTRGTFETVSAPMIYER